MLTNSILWGNGVEQVVNLYATTTITYSVVEGGYSGTGNIDVDPLLGALGNYGGSTQTFPLLPGSSAIDAGTRIPGVRQPINAASPARKPATSARLNRKALR